MSNFAFLLRAALPAFSRAAGPASICTFVIALLSVASNAFAESGSYSDNDFEFPYQAIVRHNDAEIFSGPASVHYTTDKIAQGEIVQVYRHDPGGWCAIRPNAGSFSLIPEAAVEIIEDGVGEITQDNTQAWVGTRLGSVDKPLWQIKLKAGEKVEILGEASWPSPDGNSTVWYQIAPPAGEFRWIRFADLSTPPTDTRPVADARTDRLATNQTDSGFKFDESPAAKISQPESGAQANSHSGFKYVDANAKEATAPKPRRPKVVSSDRIASRRSPNGRSSNGRSPNGRSPNGRSPNDLDAPDWQWSNSAGDKPSNATSPRLAKHNQALPRTPASPQPERDSQEEIDFKFRPIGQTASRSGSFQSKSVTKPTSKSLDKKITRDSKVAQAAYQTPSDDFYDGANFDDDRSLLLGQGQLSSNDSNWRRGRSALAQRKSQYEARYDQFNDQIQIDRRDIEDSFGVSMEDLPEHAPAYRTPHYSANGNVQSYGDVEQYQVIPESSYPPSDRFASLQTEFDTHPHSRLAEKLTQRLSKIEEHLTNEMLKRPNEWQLADIELTVGQIYSQTTNPVERLQAQRILDKITKCKVIRNGYTKNFQASGETFGTSVRSLSNARGSRLGSRFALGDGYPSASDAFSSANGLTSARQTIIGSGVNTDFEMNARFDASGWLTELVSEDRNNRPVYVLVNDNGKITHHVAGAPGLNLHRYLKSKVGISGRQGYNNRMKLDHITADVIDELQR